MVVGDREIKMPEFWDAACLKGMGDIVVVDPIPERRRCKLFVTVVITGLYG